MKKLISFFLTLVMLLSVMPMTGFAAASTGNVTNLPEGWEVENVDSYTNFVSYPYASPADITLILYKDVLAQFKGKPMTIIKPPFSDKDSDAFKGSGDYASFTLSKSAEVYIAFGGEVLGWYGETSGNTCRSITPPAWVEEDGWEPIYIEPTNEYYGNHNGILLQGSSKVSEDYAIQASIMRPYKKAIAVPEGETVTVNLKGKEGSKGIGLPYVIFLEWKDNESSPFAPISDTKVGLVEYSDDGESVTAKAWIKNDNPTYGVGPTFMVAKYNTDGSFASMEKMPITINAGVGNIYTIGPVTKPVGGSVKIFLWDQKKLSPVTGTLTKDYSGKFLDDILVNGESMEGFSEDVTSYEFEVADGSTVPVVTGIAANPKVYVTTMYGNISEDKSSVTHVVKASLNGETKEYNITFKIDDKPIVVAENGAEWSFEGGKSSIQLATVGVTKDGEPTADGILYESFNDNAPVPEAVKILLSNEGEVTPHIKDLPFFLTDYTENNSNPTYNFGESSAYSGENWITFKLNKPATVYVASQINPGVQTQALVDAGWINIGANRYVTEGVTTTMGGGTIVTAFYKEFGASETYPKTISIPVSKKNETLSYYSEYVVLFKEAEIEGLKPLVSDLTNYVKDMDYAAYYKYINGESATPESTDATGEINTINDISVVSFSNGTGIKGHTSYPSYIDSVNSLTGFEGSYAISIPSMVANWEGISTWIHDAALGKDGWYSTDKPWWSFKVNADCEVTVLAHDNVIIPAYELQGSGWTKVTLNENPGVLRYQTLTGTQKDMLNKTAYSKRFSKGDVVMLYNAKRISGSGSDSVVNNDVAANVSILYAPIIKF